MTPTTDASIPTASPTGRLTWPDVAKGVCIVLVVLHHTIGKHYSLAVPGQLAWLGTTWLELTYALKPVRMPLFFLLSGFFAASAVHRPWRAVARRVAGSYYLYAVWLALMWGLFSIERTVPMNRTNDVADLLDNLLLAATGIWYLYALAAYFVLTKLVAGLPRSGVLVAAVAFSVLVSAMGIEETNRWSVHFHFSYFAAGALFPEAVRRLARLRLPVLRTGALLAAATVLVTAAGLWRSVDTLVLSLVGVPWGIALSVRLAELPRAAAALAWLGRRTLPVYVLHMVPIAVLAHASVWLGWGRSPESVLATLLYPLLATAGVIAASLALHQLLLRLGGGWLFALPSAWWGRSAAAVRRQPDVGVGALRHHT